MTPWTPCEDCDEYWCNIHEEHAFECPCPPVEEWSADPYSPPSEESPGPAEYLDVSTKTE
jgi:hypothetical protein